MISCTCHFSLSRSLCTTPADFIDIDASTNVVITADRDDVGGVAYIGTNSNGQIDEDAGFKAIGSGPGAIATFFSEGDTNIRGGSIDVESTISGIGLNSSEFLRIC